MQIIFQGPDMALILIPEGLKRYPKPTLTEP